MTNDEVEVLITLDKFLKATQLVETGGMAKQIIQGGEVCVNGEVETRRRRKLVADDKITIDDETYRVGDAFVDPEADAAEEPEADAAEESAS